MNDIPENMPVLRAIIERNAKYEEEPPMALTDQHVAALERAIRRAGYDILFDTSTGEFELVAPSVAYEFREIGYEFKPDGSGNIVGNFYERISATEKSA